MADFNLKAEEGGYQGRPSQVYSGIDMRGDITELLAGTVSKIAGAAIDKYLTKPTPEKPDNPAIAPLSEKIQRAGRLAVMSPEDRASSFEAENVIGMASSELDKYDSVLNEVSNDLSADATERVKSAMADGEKRIAKAKAKAEQQGRSFSYESAVMAAFNDVAGVYGTPATMEAFKDLMGTAPLKFMNDKLVEAEFAMRQKSKEAVIKQIDTLADNMGLIRPVGSTDDQWAGLVSGHAQNLSSAQSSEDLLVMWNRQPLVGGKPISNDVRRPVEAEYGYSIVELVGNAVDNRLAGFDPSNASTEERMAAMQELDDVYSAYTLKASRLMVADPSLRSEVLGQIKSRIDIAKETLKSNTLTSVIEGQNKLKGQKALKQLYDNVPSFGILAEMNKSVGQFLTKDALFAGKMVELVNNSAGMDIGKLLIAGDSNALARTPASSKDWGLFVNNSLGLAQSYEVMRPVLALNSVRALGTAIDPFTGVVKDKNALVGLMTFYGDKRFLTSLYPEIKARMGDTAYNNVTKEVLTEVTGSMVREISKSPEIQDLISSVKKNSTDTVHLQFDRDGNVTIGRADAYGNFTPLPNQNAGTLNNARNALSANIRAHAHLQGTDDYESVAAEVLKVLKVNFTATMPAKRK